MLNRSQYRASRFGTGDRAPSRLELRNQKIVYANPYTGEVLGVGSQGARQFFRTVTELHRWLGAQGDRRKLGKSISGAGTLLFVALICSGVFLWWPRSWSWRAVKGAALFRPGLHGKARDWNWHNVVAIWCAIPLFIITLSGVVMSYQWANSLVFRITGNPAPVIREGPPSENVGRDPHDSNARHSDPAYEPVDVAAFFDSIERQVPAWCSITMRLGDSGPVTAVVLTGMEGRPDLRQQLTLDRASATVTRVEGFATYNSGRRLRGWLRFAHTGEAGGVLGEAIAALASLGGAGLVYTGIALALRRLLNAIRKRNAKMDTNESLAA